MARARARVLKDINRIPALLKELQGLMVHKVEVGVLGDSDADMVMIATVHEYGASITVTPKMRAFLHYEGVHLSANTTTINIPERSFMRAGFDANETVLVSTFQEILYGVMAGAYGWRVAYDRVGQFLARRLARYLVDLKTPANAPLTVERKGSSNPLVDTGRLQQSITWRVV